MLGWAPTSLPQGGKRGPKLGMCQVSPYIRAGRLLQVRSTTPITSRHLSLLIFGVGAVGAMPASRLPRSARSTKTGTLPKTSTSKNVSVWHSSAGSLPLQHLPAQEL